MKWWIAGLALLTVALAGCGSTQSDDADSDGDGLANARETTGWDIEVRLSNVTQMRHVTSDPRAWATDGSALDDHYKFALGLDPRTTDTDSDGLTDCQEVFDTSLARCQQADSAVPSNGGYKTLAAQTDTDGDGVGDGREVLGWPIATPRGTQTVTSNPLRADSDGDGLPDGGEDYLGADPGSSDSDGDGCRDGADVAPTKSIRVGPGLLNFTLNGTATKVRLTVLMGGSTGVVEFDAQPGIRVDLAGMSPAPQQPACNADPILGRLGIQLLAHAIDGSGQAKALDLGPGLDVGSFRPRDATTLDEKGVAVDALRRAGRDGVLALRPLLVETQGT